MVKINNELKFAYFVKNSVDGSAQFLIIGKKPENGGCSTNGWVVHKSLIKNVNSLSLLGKRAKNWLDTSEPPITTDDNDKIKMYMYNKDSNIMYTQDGVTELCNGGKTPKCIRDGFNVFDKFDKIVDKN